MSTIVKTQAELNAAIAADSPRLAAHRYATPVQGEPDTLGRVDDDVGVGPVGGSATVSGVGDSATVSLYDQAAATNVSPYVAVHLHSARATSDGGVIINVAQLDLNSADDWCDYHGVKVSKAGVATVYKAVDDNWTTSRGFDYSPGKKPSAPDWRADSCCGSGLHFSPTPAQAKTYHPKATRFVAVGVSKADLRPISDGGAPKCKAPKVVRACIEVDVDGVPVKAVSS